MNLFHKIETMNWLYVMLTTWTLMHIVTLLLIQITGHCTSTLPNVHFVV